MAKLDNVPMKKKDSPFRHTTADIDRASTYKPFGVDAPKLYDLDQYGTSFNPNPLALTSKV